MAADLPAVVLDAHADQLDAGTDVVPDDLEHLPAPLPVGIDAAVRRAAVRDGCTCADGLEIRSRVLEDAPSGLQYVSPLRLHLEPCPLLTADGSVRVSVGHLTAEETDDA